MMKKHFGAFAIAATIATSLAYAATNQTKVMYKTADGAYIVNTTTLTPKVKGFQGATPLEVTIKKNRVVKVTPLPNRETPKFFAKVKALVLPKYAGMKVAKAADTNAVDGATGATFSSKAVKANVAAAVAYYKAHK